jgi:hypothetical protein
MVWNAFNAEANLERQLGGLYPDEACPREKLDSCLSYKGLGLRGLAKGATAENPSTRKKNHVDVTREEPLATILWPP